MWATLTLMTALSTAPAAAGDLQLTNPRLSYGQFGPTRKETKFLPGDVCFLTFDIEGLQFDEGGNAKWTMQLDVIDPAGKSRGPNLEVPYELFSLQGGGIVPYYAFADIPPDEKPGKYKMVVLITDQASKKEAKLEREYEVAEKGFGIVHLNCTYDFGDRNGPRYPAAGLGFVGQQLHLQFGVTGFDRDPKTKQPSIKLDVRMLDAEGKPTLKSPITETFPGKDQQFPEQLALVPLNFPLALTRPGKYTVELTATDVLGKKTSTVSYPLVVQEPPK